MLLPHYKEQGKPFMLLYWSSDPDGTQHSQRDSLNELMPGINGPTSLAAIKVADDDLAAIMATLKELGLDASTNIFVTADHGFSTISKQSKTSPSAKHQLRDDSGRAAAARLPGDRSRRGARPAAARAVGDKVPAIDYKAGKHPRRASAILGNDPAKPEIVVAVNGGNDLIYFPQGNGKELAPKVVKALLAQDYTSGVFVHDDLGAHSRHAAAECRRPERRRAYADAVDRGELPLRDDRLRPAAVLRRHRHRRHAACRARAITAASAAPTRRISWRRSARRSRRASSTRRRSAMPTSRRRWRRSIGVTLAPVGKLRGRVISEALVGGAPVTVERKDIVSPPGDGGLRTIVNLQYVGSTPYFDAAGFPGRTVGLRVPEPK